MATGAVVYFNGKSGWLKQEGVEGVITSGAGNRLFLASDVAINSPPATIALGTRMTFTEVTRQPWLATSIEII